MIALGAKKQILVVGNDGVQLYVLKGKTVSLYQDFTHSGGGLTSDLKIAFKSVNLPLIVLFDVAEQQYRREAIPKVGFLDKNKVINRKLAMAFPQQLFRAFYVPKQKIRENESTLALFAGLSSSLTIMQIMDALLGSEVYIEGAVLLPLESISLVTKLSSEIHKRGKTTSNSRWSILMTQDKTGGLRQIIVKDGELALTRMTPLIVDLDQPEALGDEMVREFNATLTYLARFGYVPSDGLDFYLISSNTVGQRVSNYNLPVSNMYTMTLNEACQLAGLKAAISRDASDYGEILYAGWVGQQGKLVVPLSSAVLDKVKQSRQMARVIVFAAVIGIAYLGWQITSLQTSINTLGNDVKSQNAQKEKLQSDFEALTKSLKPLKHDPEKTKIILDAYDQNSVKSMNIKPMISKLMLLIDHTKILVKDFKIELDKVAGDATQPIVPGDPNAQKKNVTITMQITFPKDMAVEQAAHNTLDFAETLRKGFPGRTVTIDDMVGNLTLDKTVQGTSEAKGVNQSSGNGSSAESTSKITIKGILE